MEKVNGLSMGDSTYYDGSSGKNSHRMTPIMGKKINNTSFVVFCVFSALKICWNQTYKHAISPIAPQITILLHTCPNNFQNGVIF